MRLQSSCPLGLGRGWGTCFQSGSLLWLLVGDLGFLRAAVQRPQFLIMWFWVTIPVGPGLRGFSGCEAATSWSSYVDFSPWTRRVIWEGPRQKQPCLLSPNLGSNNTMYHFCCIRLVPQASPGTTEGLQEGVSTRRSHLGGWLPLYPKI